MSAQQPTYEATVALVASLQKELLAIKEAAKKGTDDNDEDDKLEASFLKAKAEVEKETKKHDATTDDMEKVKDAFRKAENETDDDKKKEAMKKALELEEDYESKKAKKGEDSPKEDVDNQPQKEVEAKVAASIMKKLPLMQKILEATKIVDPTNYAKVEKELTAATLQEVEAKYAAIKPYIASVGLTATSTPSSNGFIPFQASAVIPDNTNIFEAGVDEIDFSKVSTKTIMEMSN